MTLKSGVGSVQFYPDRPLLETELNELQSVQNEAREDIIRDSIPSGFTQLGDLDFDYMSSVDNKVKLKSDSVAFVNGMRIFIPKDTVIDLGNAPEKAPREDLVFLEVWKEEVGADGTLTQYGGEGQASIPNHILDNRVKVETAKRVINRWRIRVVPNIDFTKFPEGLGTLWVNGDRKTITSIIPIGGNTSEIVVPSNDPVSYYYKLSGNKDIATKNRVDQKYVDYNDMGIYVTGLGDSTSKTLLKTVDGYSYAIPMFRLYRKPSCGKAKPFEFRKICSLVDQSKFAKLVSSEKVEAVSDVDIKGASLVDVITSMNGGIINLATREFKISVGSNDNSHRRSDRVKSSVMKPNTQYTLILNILTNTCKSKSSYIINDYPVADLTSSVLWSSVSDKRSLSEMGVGLTKISFTTKETVNPDHIFHHSFIEDPGAVLHYNNLMILEGDWTNKSIPKSAFNGISSLGEQEGNLVTVKSGVIEKDNIDPCTDTIKTSAYSGVTNVLSPNKIIPNIEADLVRNGNVVESLTTLPYKTTNSQEGDLVRVNKVKGKTYQNLMVGCIDQGCLNHHRVWDVVAENTFETTASATYRYLFIKKDNMLLKPSTQYTIIMEVLENTIITADGAPSGFTIFGSSGSFVGGEFINTKDLPTRRCFLKTTVADLSAASHGLDSYLDNKALSGKLKLRLTVIEGDHTNNPNLPSYFEGIKSVGEEENNKVTVKSVGKNIVDESKLPTTSHYGVTFSYSTADKCIVANGTSTSGWATSGTIRVTHLLHDGCSYILSKNNPDNRLKPTLRVEKIDGSFQYVTSAFVFDRKTTSEVYAYVNVVNVNEVFNNHKVNIQLEESSTVTPYEPYKESVQTIPLKEPLRSLPNGVADSVEKVGNVYKVIRRVGKIVLNGSENGFAQGGLTNDTYFEGYGFEVYNHKDNISGDSSAGMSDRFIYNPKTTGNQEVCFINSTTKKGGIVIAKSKLTTPDLTGFKKWLQANPTTIYYELETPITEDIPHNFDRESARTYQLDSPLRSLPNGVKDEIKDGVLIRRCGQVTLNGSESDWTMDSSVGVPRFITRLKDGKIYKSRNLILSDRLLFTGSSNDPYSGFIYESKLYVYHSNAHSDVNIFKDWLKANPVNVVYELETPIEIPLKEVLPSSADYSLKRHLTATNYLRELPNGVRDTVEGGKVKRRVGRIVLNGSETWVSSSTDNPPNGLYRMYIEDNTLFAINIGSSYISNNLTHFDVDDNESLWENLPSGQNLICSGVSSKGRIIVAVMANTLVEAKQWFKNNPCTVLYPLATPTEEAITDTSIPTPCHPINTYVGGLYVAEGINHVYTDNNIPREEAPVVNTPFRQIGEVTTISDCKYKKHYDGCEMVEYGLGKNKFNNIFELGSIDTVTGENNNLGINRIRSGFVAIKGNKLFISSNKPNYAIYGSLYDYNKKCIIPLIFVSGSNTNQIINNQLIDIPPNARFIKIRTDNNQNESDFRVQIEEGTIATPYEPYIKGELPLTSLQQNNVDDLRHKVSLTGFNYPTLLADSFDLALRGELQ